jgi:DNA-binding NarL/FixJ family response regulator
MGAFAFVSGGLTVTLAEASAARAGFPVDFLADGIRLSHELTVPGLVAEWDDHLQAAPGRHKSDASEKNAMTTDDTKTSTEDAQASRSAWVRRIFLVEDHPVFRQGLAQILRAEKDLKVCGEAATAEEALSEILRLQPDLAVVDITLPGKSGLELIKELRAKKVKVKILVLSMHDEAIYANRVLRAGADGYIMKQEDPGEIVHAIRDVLRGHIYLSEQVLAGTPQVSAEARPAVKAGAIERLADAELELLELVGRGKDKREIGRDLHLTARKVNTNLTAIRKKLGVKSADALFRYAVRWVETGAL